MSLFKHLHETQNQLDFDAAEAERTVPYPRTEADAVAEASSELANIRQMAEADLAGLAVAKSIQVETDEQDAPQLVDVIH